MNQLVERVFERARAIDSRINCVVFVDFETYYAHDYTLRELTTYEFVYDKRFRPFFAMTCIFRPGVPPRQKMFLPAELVQFVKPLDHTTTLFVAHNAMFDGQCLRALYPAKLRWWCTMQAAHQTILPRTGSVSLDRVAKFYDLPVDKSVIIKMQGRHIEDLSVDEFTQLYRYAKRDVELCVELFVRQQLMGVGESNLLMWTLDRAIYPRLRVDRELLETALADEEANIARELEALNVTPEQLRSATRFAALLESLGLVVEYKHGTRGIIPAVARTDPFMESLVHHEDPHIARLAELRLALTSSLQRTRAARMLAVTRALDGALPVPLHYHRARTGRWTGAERLNLQNLRRGGGPLRKAILAAPGRALVVVDAAQIEARIVAAIAGAHDLSAAFATGRDVYAEFASRLYGHTVTKQSHPEKRQVGKLAVLSLGYGCGPLKFEWIARVSGNIILQPGEAERVVSMYRSTWPEIPQLWRLFDRMLHHMLQHDTLTIELPTVGGPVPLTWNAPFLYLPSGRPIVFDRLEYDSEKDCIMTIHAQHGRLIQRPIWGGHIVENIVQAMARDVLCRTHQIFIDTVAFQVHDELVLDVDAREAETVLAECVRELAAPIDWLPGCVFAAEGKVVSRYGDAK